MNERLNVLWLDDEHEHFNELKAYLFNHSIDVECFKSQKGALEALQNRSIQFDAILCDIQILENETSESESNRHLIPFINGIKELEIDLDPVILTGQGEKNRNEIDIMLTFLDGKTILYKRDPDVQPKIVEALKKKASARPLFQLKRTFKYVHELFQNGFLDEMALLPFKEYFSAHRLNLEHCNQLRQTLESLYRNLAQAQILPATVYSDSTQGKNAVDFLMCVPVNGCQLNQKFKLNNNVRRWLLDHFYDCSLGSHIPDDTYELRELVEDVGTDLHHSVLASIFRFEEIARYFNYWIQTLRESEEYKTQTFYSNSPSTEDSVSNTETNIIAVITNINVAGNGFARAEDQVDYYIPSNIITPQLKRGVKINITRIEPKTGDLNSKVLTYHVINA